MDFLLALKFPGITGGITPPANVPTGGLFTTGQDAIRAGLSFFLIIVLLLAILYALLGAIRYIFARGDKEKIKGAREKITYSIVGLIVAFLAFLLVGLFSSFVNVPFIATIAIPTGAPTPTGVVSTPTPIPTGTPVPTPTPTSILSCAADLDPNTLCLGTSCSSFFGCSSTSSCTCPVGFFACVASGFGCLVPIPTSTPTPAPTITPTPFPTPTSAPYRVQGFVWLDLNENGAIDRPGEPGIGEETVEVLLPDFSLYASGTTESTGGLYSIEVVAGPGDSLKEYIASLIVPAGYKMSANGGPSEKTVFVPPSASANFGIVPIVTGTIKINGGDETTSSELVTLTLSCSSVIAGPCDEMKLSNTFVGLDSADPEGFVTSRRWNLTTGAAGTGVKAVYVRFKVPVGAWSPKFADTIELLP